MASPNSFLEIPALGRVFNLGMLYDARSDQLIPGLTLWDHETLKANIDVQPKPSTSFEIIATEAIEAKSSALSMSGDLTVSFLAGLIGVSGAAEYLTDRGSLTRENRVTLQYTCTTRYEQLTMNHLGHGNTQYDEVFHSGIATHVVVGILYGADAFLLFERTNALEVGSRRDSDFLEGAIRKLPIASAQGLWVVYGKEKVDQLKSEITCKFYGDFRLNRNPAGYEEACTAYKELPQNIGSKSENVVPKKIWLCPLSLIDKKASVVMRELSPIVVEKSVRVMEDINESISMARELETIEACRVFPWINEDVILFLRCMKTHEAHVKGAMARLVPEVRGKKVEEAILESALHEHFSSPCSGKNVWPWIEKKRREISTLGVYLEKIHNTTGIALCLMTGELDKVLHTSSIEHVVVFEFCLLGVADLLLPTISAFVNGEAPVITKDDVPYWFENDIAMQKMRKDFGLFVEFAMRYPAWNALKCVVTLSHCNLQSNSVSNVVTYYQAKKTDYSAAGQVGKPLAYEQLALMKQKFDLLADLAAGKKPPRR